MIDSPLCVFCKREVESLEHLLFFCEVTKMFWRAFCTWLAECKIRIESLNILDVLFGVYNKGEDFKILNHLILSAKFYIYKCKLSGVNPSLQVFKVKVLLRRNFDVMFITKNHLYQLIKEDCNLKLD